MATYVVIENTRTGQQKTVSGDTWRLMANSKEQGDTRKGYRILKGATQADTKAKAKLDQVKTPTMIPPAIAAAAEAAQEADRLAQSQMISGAKSEELASAKQQAPAPAATQEQEAAPAVAAPAGEAPEKDLPTELAGLDESLTPKVAQVLAKAGITTKAHLKAATLPAINKVLDAAGLGAKKAQAAGWKSKAANLKA